MNVKQLDIMDYLSTQTMLHGDCLDEMRKMADNSIDFIVTDPPYGLHFMGKDWDSAISTLPYWQEILRICKPGSMMAAFGGSRTHHRLMSMMEDAGWEIRDVVMWLYGQGFPKSYNFGRNRTNPEWHKYGTALKPAYEPIILAMKPLDGTFNQNAQRWCVAGINIDESRIYTNEKLSIGSQKMPKEWGFNKSNPQNKNGRWPANLIFDEEVAEQLDQMTGILKSGKVEKYHKHSGKEKGIYGRINGGLENETYGDSGGASRFFYCAKASSRERNSGLKEKSNIHCTVKPLSLMKYILKLLAPPVNPICLDPFAGSGSTLLAAKELGINCIGIEKELEYYEIAKKRIENHAY